MPNIERFGNFYGVWPVIDGKSLNAQWGEIRINQAESKALVRNTFQELQEGTEEINTLRAYLGQAFGDLAFSKRWRFYYNKSTLEFCLQKNDGTVAVPIWTDVWCAALSDGQFQVDSPGGIFSAAGFYGPGLENIYQIGETGSEANESFTHRSKLFFNTDDGFELDEILSGGNAGGVEVRYTAPFGRAQEFFKVGKERAVEHNYGISPVLVQVMDGDKRVLIPDLADVSDPNIAYFYFNEVTTGSVYIASGGVGATSLVPRDPFYLVVRTDGQSSNDHRLHTNADLVFDSNHFYVNVSLVDKRAFVSLVGDAGGFIVDAVGDRNISAVANAGSVQIRLQPKLGGMEAFYFANGDAITHGDSIHFEVQNKVQMRLGKSGLSVTEKVKAEAFYLRGGANLSSHVTYAPTAVRLDAEFMALNSFSTGIGKDSNSNGETLELFAENLSNFIVTTKGVIVNNGNASEPSLSFTSSSRKGIYSAGTNDVGLASRGRSVGNWGPGGLKIENRIKSGGFYFSPGSNDVAWDLSKASLEIHLPTPSANTPYFLVNFVDQAFIVDDVKLAAQSGQAAFGFYILTSNEVYRNGIGIVGIGKDGNTLAEFYVSSALLTVTATSANVVPVGGSLMMVCTSAVAPLNVRGRVKIRLQG